MATYNVNKNSTQSFTAPAHPKYIQVADTTHCYSLLNNVSSSDSGSFIALYLLSGYADVYQTTINWSFNPDTKVLTITAGSGFSACSGFPVIVWY